MKWQLGGRRSLPDRGLQHEQGDESEHLRNVQGLVFQTTRGLNRGIEGTRSPLHQDHVRKVYMSFMMNRGWSCQFLEADLKMPLPRKLTFSSSDKIFQIAEHAGVLKDLAARQAIEHGIEMGRVGFT